MDKTPIPSAELRSYIPGTHARAGAGPREVGGREAEARAEASVVGQEGALETDSA